MTTNLAEEINSLENNLQHLNQLKIIPETLTDQIIELCISNALVRN